MFPASNPRRWAVSIVASLTMLLASCGGGSSGGAEPATTPASADAPLSSVVDDPSTSVSDPPAAPTGDSTMPMTTVAPSPPVTLPTLEPLPTPALVPLEDDAPEPVVPLGSISIPAIGIDRPMFEGIRLPTFDLGPGHWPGSAMPGQVGNVVVGGHRTESHADFADLDQLQPGDQVTFTDTAGVSFTYAVTTVEIVDPFAAAIVYQSRDTTATLFACHPKGSTDQRIVVRLALTA